MHAYTADTHKPTRYQKRWSKKRDSDEMTLMRFSVRAVFRRDELASAALQRLE
jgi:hypothetical protein